MNDFTKSMLKCLHNAIYIQVKTIAMSEINVVRRKELIEKLQSMIDNYCEHTNTAQDYSCTRCLDCNKRW